MQSFPLLDRDPGAVLFRSRDGARTAADFLADVADLAAALPDAPWIANGCESRYWFATTFAAGLLRGQPNLLSSEQSPASLAALARRYPGAIRVSDTVAERPPLPHFRIDPSPPRAVRSGSVPIPDIPAGRLAAIVFTSGTTGEPAAHEKSWGGLVDRSRAAAERFGLLGPAAATIVGTVPPQHMYGFETTLLLPLHAAVSSWSPPVFFPEDVRRALAAVPVPRLLVTTPLQLRALLDAGLPDAPERTISATASLDPALAATAEQAWGTEVHEIFGATEAGSIASRRTALDDVWTLYPGVSFEADTDSPVVHAPFLVPTPLQDNIEHTSDTRFRLLGRDSDMIKLGGRRASRAGLDNILNRIDGVLDGVFVVPDDLARRPSARLLAFVVAPDRTAAQIMAALRQRIDPVFLPRRIVRVPSLPRNAVGKLPREAVRALLDAADPA